MGTRFQPGSCCGCGGVVLCTCLPANFPSTLTLSWTNSSGSGHTTLTWSAGDHAWENLSFSTPLTSTAKLSCPNGSTGNIQFVFCMTFGGGPACCDLASGGLVITSQSCAPGSVLITIGPGTYAPYSGCDLIFNASYGEGFTGFTISP